MDNGVVGVVTVAEIRVVITGVLEDLEGEIEILLLGDDGAEALGGEFLRPGFDRGRDGVGLEELGLGFYVRELLVGVVGGGGCVDGVVAYGGDAAEEVNIPASQHYV